MKTQPKAISILLISAIILNAAVMLCGYHNYSKRAAVRDQLYIESQSSRQFTAKSSVYETIRFCFDGSAELGQVTWDEDTVTASFRAAIQDGQSRTVWQKDFYDIQLQPYCFTEPLELGDEAVVLTKDEQYTLVLSPAGDLSEKKFDNVEIQRVTAAFEGEVRSTVLLYAAICTLGMIIVIAASVLVLKGKGMEAVRRFLPVLILLLGLMNCIAIPCFGFPDENNHFGIAYDKAMYAIGNNEPNNLPYAYVYQSGLARTDPSLSQIEQLYRNWTDFSYGNHRTVWLSREYNRNANFVTYEYVPQIAGIAAASLAKLPWYLILTAGRLASLLFCLLIIVLCLRLVPDLSFAAAGIMLLPSVIWMLASYSYDGWNLVMCILFLTLCIWLSGKNKINIWQILALGAAFLLFVPIKYIYIVYGLMIFIIPFTKNTDKRLRVALLIIGAAVISIGLISRGKEALELLTTSLTDDRGLEQGLYGEPYSIHWVISHPIDIMLSFSKTLFVYADAILTKMMIGEFNNQRVPLIIAIISFFCVMYLLKSKGISIPQGSRKWPYLTLLFGIFAIFGSFLFLYSYRVEGTYGLISGMQGRYFLPYLILFPLLFRPEHNRISNGKECGALLCIWMLCNANVWFIIYQFTGLS